ncbi:tetraspanin-1-like [Leucoraja erinacea]|uniref:tetraspanin-1-like n=1 Tax=Leucoraja erinaceus TaxID=7782 RepID=UPI0024565617|nr:tetraspanin-1-like [Leucoraja erinacea]
MSVYKCLKLILFAFNFIIFLGGGSILGIGIWIKVDGGMFLELLQKVSASLKVVANVGYLCIALGAFLMLIGFLGCCGALKENKCMLMIFFLLILVIFLAQLVAGVVILAFSSLADIFMAYVETWLMNFVKNDYGRTDAVTETFDAVMKQFKCCGIHGYADFTGSHFFINEKRYPDECCPVNVLNLPCILPIQSQGCYAVFLKFLKSNTMILGIVAVAIGVLEIGAMASSMIMYCEIKKQSSVA